MINNVFITVALRTDFIHKWLETLYKYTDMKNNRVILVDQTLKGLPDLKGVHLKLRPHRNLGFAKAMNEGIIHGLHWKSNYVTCVNDDVEFINKRWWQGIMETFKMPSTKEILAVNPESVRIPLWGYGDKEGRYIEVLDYKENFTDADYDFLLAGDFTHLKKKYPDLPESFPGNYVGVCDAFAAWGPVFKRKCLEEIGLFEERFYPGGAEDYDYSTRVYSKGYRAVSTRKSWVWHHWGKSKDERKKAAEQGLPIDPKLGWQDLSYLWPKEYNEGNDICVWGYYDGKNGIKKPLKRRPLVAVIDI